jgi:hypothetical protein
MAARICPRCSTRVDERRARTSPFCLSCGAPLGPAPSGPSATFAGKAPGAGGGSALPWILGGIAAVVLLGFGAVVIILVAAAGDSEPVAAEPAVTATPPRIETADAAVASASPSAKVGSVPVPTVRTTRPAPTVTPFPVPTPPPPPTVTAPPTSTVTTLGPFPRSRAQGEVDRIGFGLSTCKSSAGPFGAGTMRIDFEPDGRVTTLTRPPFAGTSVGSCISARFRTIKIGPFLGSTQSIEKAFIIQE